MRVWYIYIYVRMYACIVSLTFKSNRKKESKKVIVIDSLIIYIYTRSLEMVK